MNKTTRFGFVFVWSVFFSVKHTENEN